MVEALFIAIVVMCALWVYWDATANKIGKVPGGGGILNLSAGAWSVVTMGIWIIAFPAYLIRRSALIERAKGQPIEVKGRMVKLGILAVIGVLWVLGTLAAAFAPEEQPAVATSPKPAAKAPAAKPPATAAAAPKAEAKPQPPAATPAAAPEKPALVAAAPTPPPSPALKQPAAVAKKRASAQPAAPAKKRAAPREPSPGAAATAGDRAKPARRVAKRKPAVPPPMVEMAPPPPPRTPKYNDVMTAVMNGDRAGAAEALDLGLGVDRPDSNGVTPLMAAAMNGDAAMTALLLKHGADPNRSGPGGSVLVYAGRGRDSKVVELLKKAGAR